MSKDARAFFFHFNKPASRSAGKPQISVHTKGKCLIVDNVIVEVPTKGRIHKRQPQFVMTSHGCTIIRNFGTQGGLMAIIKDRLHSWEWAYAV